jgi:hypothetical protein
MKKIKTLLEKAGVSPELASNICGSMGKFKTTLREQFETEYAAKVEQAKTVCIEETEAHKRELSRRLQIFCETKGAAIEATLAKQSALNESEALTKLNNIASLVAGLEPNGKPSGNVTAAFKKLKHKAQVANEDKKKAAAHANRKTAIATKALKTNRALVAENTRLKKKIETGTVVEGRQKPTKGRRIDKGRKGGKTRSSRPTLLENQSRQPVRQPGQPHTIVEGGQKPNYSVDGIAGEMDGDLI